MIAIEKRFDKLHALRKLICSILHPSKTFFPDRSIETLNIRLLVLLVWTGNTVSIAILMDMGFEFLFELRTTIGLEEPHMSMKTPLHASLQELVPIGCGERWCDEYICLPRANIHPRECKQLSKINRIHLDDLLGL